jgi:acetate---CoA ligase (ADP-forming)
MSTQTTRGSAAVTRMMQPRSVAILGVSAKTGSAGRIALAKLAANGFAGDIHLVGRGGGEIDGRPILTSVDELPQYVDLAIFVLPSNAVKDAVSACVRRQVRTGVIFASGFAELSEAGRAEQQAIAEIADEGGLALLGPNCLGYTNYVNGFSAGFLGSQKVTTLAPESGPGLAVIGQSGGLVVGHLGQALDVRHLPVSGTVTTGNEVGLGIADFLDYFAQDPSSAGILVFAEHIRRPADFLAAAAKARSRGKPVVMIHPGRSERAQETAASHTGALAGNYEVMRTHVEHAGVVLVETLEEVVDVAEILTRYPTPPTLGVGVLTFSGAFCGIAHDFCADLGLDVPPLSPPIEAYLRPIVPAFGPPPRNPLDLTTQPLWQPELVGIGAKALLDDPANGSLVVAVTIGATPQSLAYLDSFVPAIAGSTKPVVFSVLGDGSPLLPEFVRRLEEAKVILSRSPERTLRAVAKLTEHGRRMAGLERAVRPLPFPDLPTLVEGPLAEWRSKEILRAIGIAVPEGGLAESADEAVAIATRVGFPVALKAQAAELLHKTEAGGVLLKLADEAAVRAAWQTLHDSVGHHSPQVTLEGALVEKMAAPGVELVIGGRRDPQWGPVLLVGIGGIWVEALGDVRVLPADLPPARIAEELAKLQGRKLLEGFRGLPRVDTAAAARVAAAVGRLMLTSPPILEIDINPLIANPGGAIALDALIVCG